jgi:branched-chain amino acid transport system substrate-binding protein
MSRGRKTAAALVALTLLAAACGDDDDSDEASQPSGSGNESENDSGGGGGLELDDPVKVVLLAETTGESEVAVPFLADGAQMAIDELNAAGGVGGQEVEYERVSAPLDGAQAETALLTAVEEEPTAMLGLPSSGQVLAVAQRVGDAQIPMLYGATAEQALVGADDSIANDHGFLMRPPQREISSVMVRFVAESLGVENIGLICVNNPFGDAGCGVAEEEAEEVGANIVASETVEQDATDFSGTVVELRDAGAEAVVSYVFPNAVGAVHNALADNDLDVPHISGSSSLIAFTGAITSGNFDNLYGVDDCAPGAEDDAVANEWAAAFEEEFGYPANYLAAEAYDGVKLIAAAVEAAGSGEPGAVRDAIAETDYEGVCDSFRGEPSQGLNHKLVAVSFAGEEITAEETYELDDYQP